MAENFVLIVSITALFISFFQILMVFKLLKTHHPDATLYVSIEKDSTVTGLFPTSKKLVFYVMLSRFSGFPL